MIKTLLAEQPLLVSLMLAAVAAALIYGWLQTGKRAAAILGLVAVLLIPAAWGVAENWVTPRERIEQLIYEVADAVEANDHQRALQVIGDPATRARAANELDRFVFDQAKVTKIESIKLIEGSYPPEADVDLNARVTVSDKSGTVSNYPVVRRLLLKMQQSDDGDWTVVEYQHMPITGQLDAFSTRP